MKVSLKWLRERVEWSGSVEELCEVLTMAGVEVEGIERTGADLPQVVVGRIAEFSQHPNADRLSVCKVEDGSGTLRQIVCGAKNFKAGDFVPLALPGAVLPGDFRIKSGKLRGVESDGMMCSPEELGLPQKVDGLLILGEGHAAGTPLSEVFPSDTVLELEITPNRPDLLSYEGIAREVGALTGRPVRAAEVVEGLPAVSGGEVSTVAGCPLYVLTALEGVQVGESPGWLREKLEAAGLRSINAAVDVTNWVNLDLGQPMHVFDADLVRGDLRVRFALEGEVLKALDDREYRLVGEDLVIADDTGPVAIAGVMGGVATGVTGSTCRILLETAVFDPACVRRTSRRLGLSSDSSYRFERGVDAVGVVRSAGVAVAQLRALCGGAVGSVRVGGSAEAAERALWLQGKAPERVVGLRASRVEGVMGRVVDAARVDAVLRALGLVPAGDGAWAVPSFRRDLTREADLIEEIARIEGIQSVPARVQAWASAESKADVRHDRLMTFRNRVVAAGYFEARTMTLIGEKETGGWVDGALHLKVKNPLNADQAVLRPSLLPGLFQVAARNARAGNAPVRVFEVGRVFRAKGREERLHAALIHAGVVRPAGWKGHGGVDADFFHVKGVLGAVLGFEFETVRTEMVGCAMAASLRVAGKEIGMMGVLRPSEGKVLDLPAHGIFAEVDLDEVFRLWGVAFPVYREIPRFPSVSRDVALVVDGGRTHSEVLAAILSVKEPLLVDATLFDVFTDATGQRLAVGSKSLAYSLVYRSLERTLQAEEVTAAHDRIKKRLQEVVGATFRE